MRPPSLSRWSTTSSTRRGSVMRKLTCSTSTLRSDQPGGRIGDEAPKRAFALDAPAYRVMHLWHTRERLEERVDLSGHQAVEEGHRSEALMPVLVQDPLQRGSGEQLRRKRHATSIPWTPRFGGPSDRYTAGVSHLPSI